MLLCVMVKPCLDYMVLVMLPGPFVDLVDQDRRDLSLWKRPLSVHNFWCSYPSIFRYSHGSFSGLSSKPYSNLSFLCVRLPALSFHSSSRAAFSPLPRSPKMRSFFGFDPSSRSGQRYTFRQYPFWQ
jgi:hypothetical protein